MKLDSLPGNSARVRCHVSCYLVFQLEQYGGNIGDKHLLPTECDLSSIVEQYFSYLLDFRSISGHIERNVK